MAIHGLFATNAAYCKRVSYKRGFAMKRVKELPIVLPVLVDGGVLPRISRWKLEWLAHWYSGSFRGRVTLGQYARRHGVSVQAVAWLVARGRLGTVTRDSSGVRWVLADWPYPASGRSGGHGRGRVPDPSVRALAHTDFAQAGRGPCPSAEALEAYCKALGVSPRQALATL